MKTALKYVLPVGLMLASACAMASDRLTPHQCNSYPFKPTNGEVTPGVDNYSLDITDARARLMAKYATDCKPDQHAASIPPSNS
jgi:hypothetical protein